MAKKTKPTLHPNRETWLVAAMDAMRPWFVEAGHPLPDKLQVGVSWPKSGGRQTGTAIGQCFGKSWTKDGTIHCIVSPLLGDDPVRVLDVLLHELCHAALPMEVKHGKPFRDLAIKHFGLEGKVTATHAEKGTPCHDKLSKLSQELGPYPHSAMTGLGEGKKKRPPAGGWVKFESVSDDTYIVRVSPKALAQWGAPLDPDGDEMVPSESKS